MAAFACGLYNGCLGMECDLAKYIHSLRRKAERLVWALDVWEIIAEVNKVYRNHTDWAKQNPLLHSHTVCHCALSASLRVSLSHTLHPIVFFLSQSSKLNRFHILSFQIDHLFNSALWK